MESATCYWAADTAATLTAFTSGAMKMMMKIPAAKVSFALLRAPRWLTTSPGGAGRQLEERKKEELDPLDLIGSDYIQIEWPAG